MRDEPADLTDPSLGEAVAEALGLEAWAMLGAGADGSAHALEDGWILKLTWNRGEAAIAALLASRELDAHGALPAVRSVHAFPAGERTAYAIVRENAHGLADGLPDDDPEGELVKGRWNHVRFGIAWGRKDIADTMDGPKPGSPDIRALAIGLARLQQDDVVHPVDLHFDNVGVTDDGRVVVRDFGRFEIAKWGTARRALAGIEMMHPHDAPSARP